MSSKVEDESKPPLNNGYPSNSGYPIHSGGYPPNSVGYPSYGQAYPGYPNLPNHTYQNGGGAPPVHPPPPPPATAYYLPGHPENSHGYTFARLMLVLLIVLIVGMSVASLITWLVFGSDIPVFRVESVEIPVFDVTNATSFHVKWLANVSVENLNRKFPLFFDNIATTLFYNDVLVDASLAEAFQLGPSERKTFPSAFEMLHLSHDEVGSRLVGEMRDDRSKGVVSFDLGIALSTSFRSTGSIWRKKTPMKILCEDLEVVFPPGTSNAGGGKWKGGHFKDCLVWT